jgi:hypothetical protein
MRNPLTMKMHIAGSKITPEEMHKEINEKKNDRADPVQSGY